MALHLVGTPGASTLCAPAYVQIWPQRMDVYLGGKHGEVITIPLIPAPSLDLLLQASRELLTQNGWGLGIDGWRKPLDPNVGLIATAHLVDVPRAPTRPRSA